MGERKVLIANPCDAERALLAHALQGSGFAVLQAVCAKEAIEIAQRESTQLILLDALNWEAPALTTLKVLKHHARTCRIPVVLFGNPRSKEDVVEAVRKGAASWVGRKAFDLTRFVEKLSAIADQCEASTPETTAAHGSCPTPAAGADLPKLTPALLAEAFAEVGMLPVFEFSVVDAVTTTCTKDQAAEHVSGIVSRDPAMSLALLAAANLRAGGAGRNRLSNPRDALNELGLKGFYKLAESVPPLKQNLSSIWDAGYFWAHSVATARIAAKLSSLLDLATPEAAITAGLLHDLGYYVLATLCPKHYGALFSAATESDAINPVWEKNLIGAHHGEIGAWTMDHYGLPAAVSDAAGVHHVGGTVGQALSPSSRLVAMVVQAADCLAAALFPADPPLMSLTNPFEEFESAITENDVNVQTIVDESRKVIAELLTEMAYLFPQSVARSFFYRSAPLGELAYFAPGARSLDVFRLFLEVRSRKVHVLDRRTLTAARPGIPLVVNLSGANEPAAQIEILTTLMAAGLMEGRCGVVLIPAELPGRAVHGLISSSWKLVPLPAHSSRWVRFLTRNPADEFTPQPCVA